MHAAYAEAKLAKLLRNFTLLENKPLQLEIVTRRFKTCQPLLAACMT